MEELRKKKGASREEGKKMDDKLAREDVKKRAVAVEKTAADKATVEPKKEKLLTTVGGNIVIQHKEATCAVHGRDKAKTAVGNQEVGISSEKENSHYQSTADGGDLEKEEVDDSSAGFVRSARAKWLSLL